MCVEVLHGCDFGTVDFDVCCGCPVAWVAGIRVADVGDFEHHVFHAVVPLEKDANVLHAISYAEGFGVLDPIVRLLVEVTAKICIFEKVRINEWRLC